MTEIKIDRNFTFVFYDNANATPDICFDNHAGFYSTEESTSISIDQAKQLISELTKFIEKNTNA